MLASTSKSAPPLPRFGFLLRPKWIAFHALVLAAVVTMVNLGLWQLNRLDERKADNAAFVAQIEQSPVPIGELLAEIRDDPAGVVNRRVLATGSFSPDQIVLFNRSQGGRAVDNVLARLQLADESVLIVNRGSIPVEAVAPSPFPGDIEILGRLRLSESRERGGLSDAEQDVITQVRRVDIDQIAAESPGADYVPMYVELLASEPAVSPADPQLLDPPELSEGNHLSYAFQWFIFAFCVVVGWVLAVRRSLTTAATAGRTRPDSPTPDDVASTTRPA